MTENNTLENMPLSEQLTNPNNELLAGLNDKQYQCVALGDKKNALIIAGAGSGKTRVLTHRIAYLISQKNISADAILALTFTNKAASEIRERLSALLKCPVNGMWTGTFHSIANRLLRTHYKAAKLSQQFQILDSQDQFRIIKAIMKENNVDENKFPVRKIQWFINQQKDEGLHPDDIEVEYNYFVKQSVIIFESYEKYCQANSVVDFAGLLMRSYELIKDNQDILSHYQQTFKHILVDEFQDTNNIQYKFIKLLSANNVQIFCVGDDDQSIYGWRGAKIENIQKLENDFSPIQTIRLEQNYRSTGNILAAANALIVNNNKRLGKTLWTEAGDGELIDLYQANNETEEAEHVVKNIKNLLDNSISANDCAILYRTNAQSRVLEEILIKYNIPYVIYGGLRFFERAEIKDAMAYLRLIENNTDDVAFERIINMPTRGIGNATLDKIKDFAQKNHTSLFQASINISADLPTRASNALVQFVQLIEQITTDTRESSLSEAVSTLLESSGLIDYYGKQKNDKARGKKENLTELINAAKQYIHDEQSTINEVLGFISLAALESSNDNNKSQQQNVQLMTIHSSKGLEFKYVFLAGMEDGLFPTSQSKEEPHLMDEERRLCYVGMTRAMKKLNLSFTYKRFIHGKYIHSQPSRFLHEIPPKYLNVIKSTEQETHATHSYKDVNNYNTTPKNNKIKIGSNVVHKKFGIGVIINFEGSGEAARIQVKFKKVGVKWLIVAYAKLEFI